jgi:putative permease
VIQLLRDWFDRNFSDPRAVVLALLLVFGFGLVIFASDILAPLFAAIVIAYLLDGPLERIVCCPGMPRVIAVSITLVIFMTFLIALLVIFMPLLFQQAGEFLRELPDMIGKGQKVLLELPQQYPQLFSEQQVQEMLNAIRSETTRLGQRALSISLSSIISLITMMVYLILVPLLVFFFLKDKDQILAWVRGFMPTEDSLARQVWGEVNIKIGSYVRGKFMEIIIIWAVTYVTFLLLGLNYAMLLSVMVGLSVIIPYVGAAIATLPIAFVAYAQWGLETEFWYVMFAYGIIQFLDGNLLVPLLFSEVVNLHPVAIITAVLLFGGLWGVWGVFFAIPLATLIQAVLKAWPRHIRDEAPVG